MNEKNKWRYLSYLVSDKLSAYRNGPRVELLKCSAIENGDVSNHTAVNTSLHFGTHIDFPNHFFCDGKTSADYQPDFFITEKVAIIFIKKLTQPNLLSISDIDNKISCYTNDIECVLVYTGLCERRHEEAYWNDNIGINTGVALYLRDRFPQLRYLGFDFMSVSGSNYRELGRVVHKEFFDNDILPIEDMDLSPLRQGDTISQLIISPFRVAGAEAAPVTVFGNIYSHD